MGLRGGKFRKMGRGTVGLLSGGIAVHAGFKGQKTVLDQFAWSTVFGERYISRGQDLRDRRRTLTEPQMLLNTFQLHHERLLLQRNIETFATT